MDTRVVASMVAACAAFASCAGARQQPSQAAGANAADAVERQSPGATPLAGLSHDAPFFPGARYDSAVPTPDAVLGYRVGDKPATHGQIEAVFRAIAEKSPRTRLFEYGRTHEGRALWYMVIATPERIQRLDALKADLAKLADPRSVSAAEADRLAADTPAVAWMGYGIHGDEMSGCDAALAAAHHLAAGQDDEVKGLLYELVVIIDPSMNPDGRDRCIRSIEENRTAQPSVDDQSLIHSGVWPSGRMNHYLFDMNRDWIFGTQPETRGRIAAVRDWHPHYFMESHEMGSQDTFLFMPAREPYNPNYPQHVRKWVDVFAAEQAAAFDARGWRYYTGEWNEEWYPGYSSSWAAMRGAVENLYEQASISSDAVRRPEGTLEPYREAVHKQLVSTMANLKTLAANRRQVVADFVMDRRACVDPESPYAQRTFAVMPGTNASRLRAVLDLVSIQGFEAHAARQAFKATGRDRLGRDAERDFPAGTVLIPNRQPLARLLAAMFEFDPRMTKEFLTEERRELLRFDRSRLYDITGWSIPMLFDVECVQIASDLPAAANAQRLGAPAPAVAGSPQNGATTVGFVIDGADDRSVVAAARLMDRGVWVRVANKPIEFDGRKFARGGVVVLRKDNPPAAAAPGDALAETVAAVCVEAGVEAVGVKTGMGPGDSPDLGGEHFVLLHPPRIAVVGREPFSAYSYGTAWYTIDHVLGVRASYLDARQASSADLRRYNVIVLPEGGRSWISDNIAALKAWVEGGGTLVALGSSAAAVASEKGIGSTRQLSDVVGKPDPYIQSVIREWEGLGADPNPEWVWAATAPTGDRAIQYPWDGTGDDRPGEDELKRRDEWRRIFAPQGVIVAGRLDDRSWLTAGCGEYIPVLFGGNGVLVVPGGVQAAVRLGVFAPAPPEIKIIVPQPAGGSVGGVQPPKDEVKDEKKEEKPKPGWTIAPPGFELRLRMSGLLWPEAAERLANSAYVTRESIGSGQVVLFADDPNFRAATLGTQRIFANAVLYGPGMGASQPITP